MSGDVVAPGAPLLSVVNGDPTPEDLAALVAVVATRSGNGDAAVVETPSQWRNRARYVRRPLTPGAGAWRASALPH